MELENQVVSLELSKKLKDAGYPQEGLFWHCLWTDRSTIEYVECDDDFVTITGGSLARIVAPTVAELGEELRKVQNEKVCISAFPEYWESSKKWEQHVTHYYNPKTEEVHDSIKFDVVADNEADARALMWLKLKEEGLL